MIAVLFGIAAASAAAPIVVEGHHDNEGEYNRAAKLDHILPEIYGSQITVTKKTSVTKLDQEPPIIDNDVNELFLRTPGVLVSEQGTPTQYNLSYRGLGNPQESEFVLVLQDGIPIQSDWIGFPTLYYVPVPQSLSEVQTVRGGSSLLYGPEPAPAINFISKRPNPKGPELTGLTQQIGGSNGLYSTYNEMEGASGGFEYRADLNYSRSDGERQNRNPICFKGMLTSATVRPRVS